MSARKKGSACALHSTDENGERRPRIKRAAFVTVLLTMDDCTRFHNAMLHGSDWAIDAEHARTVSEIRTALDEALRAWMRGEVPQEPAEGVWRTEHDRVGDPSKF